MIQVIDKREASLTDYEKHYFPYTEAPDSPRRNVKEIKLKVSDKRHYDFRKGAAGDDDAADDAPAEEPAVDDTADDAGDDGIVTDDDDDVNEDDLGDDDTGAEDTPEDTDEDIATDNDPDVSEDDMGDDNGGDDAGEDTGADGDDDGGGDDDIVTDDDEDVSEDNTTGDDNGDQGDGDDDQNDDQNGDQDNDKDETIHKQNLYKKFVTLHTAVDGYTHKLTNLIGADIETNEMYTDINRKLQDLRDLLYDYMILKFQKNSYLESMLFYQRSLAAINMCLDALASVNKAVHEQEKSKPGANKR